MVSPAHICGDCMGTPGLHAAHHGAAFVLAGLGLCGLHFHRKPVSIAACGLLFGGGELTLVQCVFDFDLSGDPILLKARPDALFPFTGRSSPLTAFCFAVFAVGLWLAARPRFSSRRHVLACCGGTIIALCGVAAIALSAGLRGNPGWTPFNGIAPHTAAGLSGLAIALFGLAYQDRALITVALPNASGAGERIAGVRRSGGLGFRRRSCWRFRLAP